MSEPINLSSQLEPINLQGPPETETELAETVTVVTVATVDFRESVCTKRAN